MFLKRVTTRKSGKLHTNWALIESIRTERGPRQRTVAYLGELKKSERAGWAQVQRLLDRRDGPEQDLFHKREEDPVPEHVQVNVRGVQVEEVGDFGDVYLGWKLWRALRLDKLLEQKKHSCFAGAPNAGRKRRRCTNGLPDELRRG